MNRPFLALVTLLACCYMLTYSGIIESGDSFQLYDAVSSFVTFNDLLLDVSGGMRQPQSFTDIEYYPFSTVDAEPLQIVLAAPLYWLAQHLPGIGLAHTGWLFNVLVCALAGGVLYLYAVDLGYSRRVGIVAALALGLGTITWAYSKTFFREPLAMLMILLAAWMAHRWRVSSYRSWRHLLLLMLACLGILLAKATAVLALPAVLLIAAPEAARINRRVLIGAGLALALLAGVFVLLAFFGEQIGVGARYNPLARIIGDSTDFFPTAIHSYLISPGGSLWGTSPVILLALPGLWLLHRRRQYRYVIAVPLALLAFAFGYALSSGAYWFGGMSWPPRFLLPVVPLLIIPALPVFEHLVRRPYRFVWVVPTVLLGLYSVWVQLSAVSLWWGEYPRALPPEAGGLIEWGGGLNDPRYFRWVLIPSLWGDVPLDFAWTRTNQPLWAVGFAVLALVCLWLLRRPSKLIVGLPAAFVLMTFIGLRLIHDDPYYLPPREGLFPMLEQIERETMAGDVVLLNNREYERFFFNYARFGAETARIATQPIQYGDRPSEAQPAERESRNPDALLLNLTTLMIHKLTATRERLWLLENRGPDFPWAVRPIERFMAQHYYPLRVITTGAAVRLIEYSTVSAPDPYDFRSPDTLSDLVYDNRLRLAGFNLPAGTTFSPGDALPLSLSWQAAAPLDEDYYIAWFLRAGDGSAVAQGMDSRPGGDFERTSQWQVGVPHWDNRALRIPADVEPGQYQVWVKVYRFDPQFTPVDLPVTSGQQIDEVIGVLPVTIRITER